MQITGDLIDRIDRDSLATQVDERAARRALRGQIARLERELSAIVADGFPYIPAPHAASPAGTAGWWARRSKAPFSGTGDDTGAPALLDLEGLERTRDELAGMVQSAGHARAERLELQTRARELLEAMQREPARYKFVRLPVRALGEGSCGFWQVRPRLGLLGMLAGWWQVKLSSGCPLGQGPRTCAAPAQATGCDRLQRPPAGAWPGSRAGGVL